MSDLVIDGTGGGNHSEGGSGGNYATGGVVSSPGFVLLGDGAPETRYELRGEPGPEVKRDPPGDYVQPDAGLVSRLDTRATTLKETRHD